MVEPVESLFGEKLYMHRFKINGKMAFEGDVWQWHVADDLATAPFMHLEQLAPGVRHAQRRGDTLFGQRVIAREIIADQGAREILQHAPGIFATAPKGEVEQHRALGYEVSGAVHPHVGPLFSPARRQQLHRRLVGVDHAAAKEHGETLGAR